MLLCPGARLVAAVTFTAAMSASASAQVRASEHGTVAQTIDGTTITVEYYRPVARGRDHLFGGVVAWGETWTPGANWATTLEVDKDVHLNGHALPKGKYSVWMIPQQDTWTVILSRSVRRFHTQRPDGSAEQLRFEVKPETGPSMETLAWYFPLVGTDVATLRMHWGSTFVSLRVAAEPSAPVALDPEDIAPIVGTYAMKIEGPDAPPMDIQLEVFARDGGIWARSTPPPPGMDAEFQLLPDGKNRFRGAFYKDGKIYDVDADTAIQFLVPDGQQATGFEWKLDTGAMFARGERKS